MFGLVSPFNQPCHSLYFRRNVSAAAADPPDLRWTTQKP